MSWEIYFRENGIRVTAGRISILNIIEASEKGLSAENIYDECKKQSLEKQLEFKYNIINKKDLSKGLFFVVD